MTWYCIKEHSMPHWWDVMEIMGVQGRVWLKMDKTENYHLILWWKFWHWCSVRPHHELSKKGVFVSVYIRVETERSFVGERCRLGPRCCVAWYSSEPEHISDPQTSGPTLHHPHPQLPHHRCVLTRRMPMAVHCLPGAGPPLQGTISLCPRQNQSDKV